ncbi:MAG: GAF domain-containing sensor histidine kinase [Chloroflexota bacterium]|nr:MAG: GAF domain-containing sensor histidine kinase [Chloroflexota bacterium]
MRRSLASISTATTSRAVWKPGYLAWSLAALSIVIILATFWAAMRYVILTGEYRTFLTHQAITPLLTIAFSMVGALIASRVPKNPIGWIFLVIGIIYALNGMGSIVMIYSTAIFGTSNSTGYRFADWLTNWLWMPAVFLPTTIVLLYFPDGRLPSPRWRFASLSAMLGIAIIVLVAMLHPGPLGDLGLRDNPFGIPAFASYLEALINLGYILLAIGFFSAMAATVTRFRNSRGIEREQMKWLIYALSLLIVSFLLASVLWFLIPDSLLVGDFSIIVTDLTILGIAIAAAIAILRYRLYDIDLIINRTLVFSALTAGVILIYVLVVGAVGLLFQQTSNLLVSLLATSLAALLIQPLRERLQRGVNRLMYGELDNPYTVLSGLDRRLEESLSPETTLPIVVETVAQALKLPYVAVELADQGGYRLAAAFGLSPTRRDQHIAMPLVYQNERVGRLVLSPRSAGESFNPAEQELLADIARHVSVAANAVLLTENLQRSRERIVTAREEERRRLSRDLHDGLGPQLVSLGFKVEAAQNLLAEDRDKVRELLSQLKIQTKSALSDVRRIAYDLRPPALDQLGLIPAVEEYISNLDRPGGMEIKVEAPGNLPELPAAIEVAAYRIALEAITNVTNHAAASLCTLRLKVTDMLEIEVEDNGQGIPMHIKPGVGISSMKDRAEELGGTFNIARNPGGGTRLVAKLPLHHASDGKIGGE